MNNVESDREVMWHTPTILSPEDSLIFGRTSTPKDGDTPISGTALMLAGENIQRGRNQTLKTH